MKVWDIVKKGLFKMHLWLPIAYSVVFLIIAAASQVLGESWPFYFIGLSVSLLGALVLAYLTLSRTPVRPSEQKREDIPAVRPEPAPAYVPPSGPRPSAVRPDPAEDYARTEKAAARVSDEQARYTQAMTGQPNNVSELYTAASPAGTTDLDPPEMRSDFMRPDAMQSYYGEAVVPDTDTARSAHDELYPSSPYSDGTRRSDRRQEERRNGPAFSPYVQPVNAASPNAAHIEDYDNGRRSHRGEKPTIYRTRKDPNVLVYEYSDCYERYYMNQDGSLTYLNTENKEQMNRKGHIFICPFLFV